MKLVIYKIYCYVNIELISYESIHTMKIDLRLHQYDQLQWLR